MSIVTEPGKVNNVTSEQLRQYQTAHHEGDYALVDVRQPEEYQAGHIPGALLMPLGELDEHVQELRQMAQRTVVFYCRSGGRSARASAWAVSTLAMPKVGNLLGGFTGFRGASLPAFPRLKLFTLQGTTEGLLRRALELEKGTYRLYTQLATQYGAGPVAEAISGLADAELAHGRVVHGLLSQVAPGSAGEFVEQFEQLPDDLVESGESLTAVADRAHELGGQGTTAVLELALEIELTAYDLYKNLAAATKDTDARETMMELAQQEKHHADHVLRALGKLAMEQAVA